MKTSRSYYFLTYNYGIDQFHSNNAYPIQWIVRSVPGCSELLAPVQWFPAQPVWFPLDGSPSLCTQTCTMLPMFNI